MASHSRILAWNIPKTEEPGGLQSTGSQRVRHDWSDLACTHMKRLKELFRRGRILPDSHGQGHVGMSLMLLRHSKAINTIGRDWKIAKWYHKKRERKRSGREKQLSEWMVMSSEELLNHFSTMGFYLDRIKRVSLNEKIYLLVSMKRELIWHCLNRQHQNARF